MKNTTKLSRSPIFEELEPRLLFSADIAEALATEAVEQDFDEEPIVTADLESETEVSEVVVDQPVEEEPAEAVADSTPTEEVIEDEDITDQETSEQPADEAAETDTVSEQARDEEIIITDSATSTSEEIVETELFDTIESTEIVFVNDNIHEYEQLVDDLLQEADSDLTIEVVILDDTRNGIEQITQTLQEHENLDAIHFISHGSEAQVSLGSSLLDIDNLGENTSSIQHWGDALTEDGDLFIYGCNLAASEDGQALVDSIASLTGADVAATIDVTGHVSLGGDWELEYQTGKIDADLLFSETLQETWYSTLTPPAANNDTVTTVVDTPVLIDVTNNDSDPEGDLITVLQTTKPTHGTAINNGNGTINYIPDSGYFGTDNFDYLVTDISGTTHFWGLEGDADDSIGSADGTLYNGPATVIGSFGNALSFDGTDDYIEIPDFSYNDEFSVTFNFKIDDWTGSSFQYLYSHGDITTDTESLAVFLREEGVANPGMLQTYFRDVDDSGNNEALQVDISSTGLGLINDGAWHTYTLTVESGNGSKVYIDGDLEAFDASRGGDSFNPDDTLYLGERQVDDGTRYYGGELDSVQIFNGTLSSGEVSDLYNTTNTSATVTVTVNSAPTDITLSQATAVSIDNSSFEDQVLDNGVSVTTVTSWTDSGDSGVWNPVSTEYTNEAPDGANIAYVSSVAGGETLAQQLAETFVADRSYTLSAMVGDEIGADETSTWQMRLYAGNELLGSVTNADFDPTENSFLRAVLHLDADTLRTFSSEYGQQLKIEFYNDDAGGGADLHIDDVQLEYTAISVAENVADGTVVADIISVTDPNAADTHSYSLTDNAGGRFAINSDTGVITVSAGSLLDYESNTSHDITIEVTDSGGLTYTEVLTVAVANVNEAPTLVALSNHTIDENTDTSAGTTFGSLTTTDPDSGDTAAYSITGGVDAAVFSISGSDLIITDGILDYETQSSYHVTVRVTDSDGETFDQHLTINVSDIANTLIVDTITNDNDSGIVNGNSSHTAEWLNANKGTDASISLREAIIAANNTSGTDTISFDIAGAGVHTIDVASALPTITDTIIIDGTTEPDFTDAPVIELYGHVRSYSGLLLDVGSDGSIIQGLAIYSFGYDGIQIKSDNNTIIGNYIGLMSSGDAIIGYYCDNGIQLLEGASGNIIGGNTSSERNIISGNDYGIRINGIGGGVTDNTIQGNYIGTDWTGTVGLGNNQGGILISSGASNNLIGGSVSGTGNLISGNNKYGILIQHATTTNNTIQGNLIGTDVTGRLDLGNNWEGIRIDGARNTIIGGDTAFERNILSGNNHSGIGLFSIGTTNTLIQGNYIGTDITGLQAIANSQYGIRIYNSSSNIIGGDQLGEGNLISGNSNAGINFEDSSDNNTVHGNKIGLDANGDSLLGNSIGINLTGSASNNLIGGTVLEQGNEIAGNSTYGILINQSTNIGNAILRNTIYDNGSFGIDLAGDGVTENDALDADAGANNLQNFAVLSSANSTGTEITISGSLNSTASTNFRLEFFANVMAETSNHGEAERYLGFINVTTDANGNIDFTTDSFAAVVPAGEFISSTATRADATYSQFYETSEFSSNIIVNVPVVTTTQAPLDYLENGTTQIDTGLMIVDADNSDLVSATVSITSNFNSSQDSLIFVNQSGITGSYNAGTGVLTLSGTATVAAYQTALRSVSYNNNSDQPDTLTRTVSFTVNDATNDSFPATRDINVANTNDAPVITIDSTTATFTEDSTNAGDAVASFSTTDEDGDTVTVTLSDTVNYVLSGNTVQLTAAGADLVNNGADLPSFTLTPNDTFVDGDFATVTPLATTDVNDAPELNIPVSQTVIEETSSAINGISLTDVDANNGSLTLRLQVANGELAVFLSGAATISSGGNGSPDMTLQGSVTDLNNTLANLNYTGNTDEVGTGNDTLWLTLNDQGNSGNGGALEDTGSVRIDITNVNDAPVITIDSTTATFTEDSTNAGDAVASFSTTDEDGDPVTVTLSDTVNYVLSGNTVQLAAAGADLVNSGADLPSFTLTPNDTTIDGTSATVTPPATTDVNDAPVITIDSTTATFTEDSTNAGDAVASFSTTDEDGDTVTVTLSDTVNYVLSGNTVQLTAAGADLVNSGADLPEFTLTPNDTFVDGSSATVTPPATTDVNDAPVLGAIGNQTVDELATLSFTATATDSDLPADTLTFSLDAASIAAGMSIDANTGAFSWTPTESQGGTTPSVTVTVTDNGTGNLVDSETFTITVGDVNTAPILGAIGNQSVDELATLSFTATATDSDLPADTLTFSLDAASIAAGMTIDANTGAFSWPPTESQGGTTPSVTVTVTDNGTGNLVDSETFTITVGDVNTAPVLGAIGNQSVDELATLSFTATATDSDLPADTLTFSLDAASITAGMTIDANTGAFSWTPTELQGGTTPSVTITVTDNGTGSLIDSETFTITVADINVAPVLGAIGDQTVDELATLSFTATATDSDLPADTLTFSLDAASIALGMSIDGNTGDFSWTPTELQGGITPSVTITVTDDGTGTLVDSEIFTITVADINDAPVITSAAAVNAAENQTAVVTVTATDADSDIPTFSISGGADAGLFSLTAGGVLTFNSGSDFETFADSNSDGVYEVEVTADDGNTGTDVQTILVTVTNVNENPTLVTLSNHTIAENTDTSAGTTIGSLTTTDPDSGDTATYTIHGGADAAAFSISGSDLILTDGVLDFETQGSYTVTVQVSDTAGLTHDQTFTITVNDVATAITVGQSFSVAEDAADSTVVGSVATTGDTPVSFTITLGNTGTVFAIDNSGNITVADTSVIDYETLTSYTLTVQVSDGTTPVTETVTINVTDVNENPVGVIADTDAADDTVAEDAGIGATVGVTAFATDLDGSDSVTYSLSDSAGGLFAIDANSGIITVANALDYETATSHSITVLATSSDTSTSSQAFTINVTDINESAISAITDSDAATNTVAEDAANGTVVGITALATDADATDTVVYSLSDNGGGLFSIDANTGIITVANVLDYETATSHALTVRSDSTDGSFSETNFIVQVSNVNETVSEDPAETGSDDGSESTDETETDSTVDNEVENTDNTNESDDEIVIVEPPTDDEILDLETDEEDSNDIDEISVADFEEDQPVEEDLIDDETQVEEEEAILVVDSEDTTESVDILTNTEDQVSDYPAVLEEGASQTKESTDSVKQAQKESYARMLLKAVKIATTESLEFIAPSVSAAPLYFNSPDLGEIEIVNEAMRTQLSYMNQEMDQSFENSAKEQKIKVYMASGMSASFAVGTASYLLRGGSLLSSFLTTVPLWKAFDPVAILMFPKPKKKKNKKDIKENAQQTVLPTEQKAETMFTENENP